MRRLILALSIISLSACAKTPDPKAAMTTDDQKALYSLGYAIGKNLNGFYLTDADLKFIQAGLSDQAAGKSSTVDAAQADAMIQALQQQRMQSGVAKAHTEGSAYLEKAATAQGAVKTTSGMVIQSIKEGSGASPTAQDTVKVHYTGTFINGEKFDSSRDRGEPATFPLAQVIPCWTEGLQQIKVGGNAKLVCPAELAYGDRPRPSIPAGSTLLFDVELLEIVKAGPAQPPQK